MPPWEVDVPINLEQVNGTLRAPPKTAMPRVRLSGSARAARWALALSGAAELVLVLFLWRGTDRRCATAAGWRLWRCWGCVASDAAGPYVAGRSVVDVVALGAAKATALAALGATSPRGERARGAWFGLAGAAMAVAAAAAGLSAYKLWAARSAGDSGGYGAWPLPVVYVSVCFDALQAALLLWAASTTRIGSSARAPASAGAAAGAAGWRIFEYGAAGCAVLCVPAALLGLLLLYLVSGVVDLLAVTYAVVCAAAAAVALMALLSELDRGQGWSRLMKVATPEAMWLALGCYALVLRLPFSLALPHFVSQVIGSLIEEDSGAVQNCILGFFVCGCLDAIGDFWCVFLFGYCQQRIIKGLRISLFRSILRQDFGFLDTTSTGEVTSRLTADCAEMANDLTWYIFT